MPPMAHYGTVEPSGSGTKGASKSNTTVEETSSLLSQDSLNDNQEPAGDAEVGTKYLIAFYTSHALFMWNNRCYEFAALLFTSAVFPHTLTAASVRGLCAHLASVVFSSSLGRWVSRHPSRLRPVQGCIIVQRICITLTCLGFLPLILGKDSKPDEQSLSEHRSPAVRATFAVLVVLGMFERLSAVGNFAMVEREWLPLLSTSKPRQPLDGQDDACENPRSDRPTEYGRNEGAPHSNLHILNATTKRIDLVTKLIAPLAIGHLVISTESIRLTAIILALTQLISCVVELYCTNLVWTNCKALQEVKPSAEDQSLQQDNDCSHNSRGGRIPKKLTTRVTNLPLVKSLFTWFGSFAAYMRNPICLPSLAYVLEPFSVLTLAGSMTAYLLAADFSLGEITIARTASSVVELSSTIITPLMISLFSKKSEPSDTRDTRPLIIVGLVGLVWQLMCLLPVMSAFMFFPALHQSVEQSNYGSISKLVFAGIALSRLGPFAYSLVEQQLVQVEVATSERVEFSSVETALFDGAELARWCMLGIFSSVDNFRWAAVASFISIVLSLAMVLSWLKKRRRQPSQTAEANDCPQ